MILKGALSVFRFEFGRTLTLPRMFVWLLLTVFPIFVVSVMKYYEKDFEMGPLARVETRFIEHEDGRRELRETFPDGTIRVQERLPGEDRFHLRSITRPDGLKRTFPRPELDTAVPLLNEEPGEGEGPAMSDAAADEEIVETQLAPVLPADDLVPRYPPELWGMVLFFLIPEVITLFSLLLWVTPIVHAELEGRTWIYLASRPRGRVSVLLGKYLTAITWTMLAGAVSTTVCVCVARPDNPFHFWAAVMGLVIFSCVSYASLYSVFGVLFRKRAMVIAVAYTLIFEFLVSMIPAVINQLTVQYRLRNLLFSWMNWRTEASTDVKVILRDMEIFLGNEPAWLHVAILCGISVGLLFVASQIIQRMEYVTAADA